MSKILSNIYQRAVPLREELRSMTALLSLIPIVLIWAGGLLLASADMPVWNRVSIFDRYFGMAALLILVTFLSMLPLMIWATFDSHEKERVQTQTAMELERSGWHNLLYEVRQYYDAAHHESRYRIPVLAATGTAIFGWTSFVFSSGLGIVNELILTGTVNGLLEELGRAHPVTFSFLGAYLFVIGILIRRYHRSDLSPSVFMGVVYQIWTAMIITFTLSVIWTLVAGGLSEDAESGSIGNVSHLSLIAVSFAAGIAPWPLLRDMRSFAARLRSRVFKSNNPDPDYLDPHMQLTSLQGLNEYHAQRLLEEGIEDVAGLAMADVPLLLVSGRLGGVRLLDWVDQAMLRTVAAQDLHALSTLGIRTASDLVRAYLGTGQSLPDYDTEALTQLKPVSRVLQALEEGPDKALSGRLYHYVFALWNEPNYHWLRYLGQRAVENA